MVGIDEESERNKQMTAAYIDQYGNQTIVRDKTTYEWDIETYYDGPDSDIEDHCFFDKLTEMPNRDDFELYNELVLVRDVGNEIEGLNDRAWAYVKDGKLPEFFGNGVRVPKRFHTELAKA